MSNPNLPKIKCAKCGRQVDLTTLWQHPLTKVLTIQVKCHGEVEQHDIDFRRLSHRQMVQLLGAEGVAFDDKNNPLISADGRAAAHAQVAPDRAP